eukprot:SAG22_NODE_1040_length_5886_cov_3.559855_5_plen_194_part_00
MLARVVTTRCSCTTVVAAVDDLEVTEDGTSHSQSRPYFVWSSFARYNSPKRASLLALAPAGAAVFCGIAAPSSSQLHHIREQELTKISSGPTTSWHPGCWPCLPLPFFIGLPDVSIPQPIRSSPVVVLRRACPPHSRRCSVPLDPEPHAQVVAVRQHRSVGQQPPEAPTAMSARQRRHANSAGLCICYGCPAG